MARALLSQGAWPKVVMWNDLRARQLALTSAEFDPALGSTDAHFPLEHSDRRAAPHAMEKSWLGDEAKHLSR